MLNSYNPFSEVIESNHFMNARAKRTGFWRKMTDSFFVFSGSFFTTKKTHPGLFDYATLMIPYAISYLGLTAASKSTNNPAYLPIAIPALLVAAPLALVRYSLAAAFSIITSPLTLLAHGISRLTSRKYRQRINNMEIQKENGEFSTLAEYIKNTESNGMMRVSANCEGDTYQNLTVYFKEKPDGKNLSSSLACEGCLRGDHRDGVHYDYKAKFNLEKSEDNKNIEALLNLNIGNLTKKLEKPSSGFTFSSLKLWKNTDDEIKSIISSRPISTIKRK